MRQWADVKGLEGRYQVSDDGFVRSLPDIDERGRFMPGFVLKAKLTSKGYMVVVLCGKSRRVHRLVAETFIPNDANLPQVNHKDGRKANNKVGNLEWTNNSANQLHRYSVLKHKPAMLGRTGALCKNSKPVRGLNLSTGEHLEFAAASEAARALSISSSGISLAARGGLASYKGWQWEYTK